MSRNAHIWVPMCVFVICSTGKPSTAPWTRAHHLRQGFPLTTTRCWDCTTPKMTSRSARRVRLSPFFSLRPGLSFHFHQCCSHQFRTGLRTQNWELVPINVEQTLWSLLPLTLVETVFFPSLDAEAVFSHSHTTVNDCDVQRLQNVEQCLNGLKWISKKWL